MKKLLLSVFAGILLAMNVNAQTGNVGIGTSVPGSKLTVEGSFAATYKTKSASYTLDKTDYYVAYDASTAGTFTLPTATAAAPADGNILGRTYHIKNTGTAVLTVTAAGSELIDNQSGAGIANFTLDPGYYALIISKGTASGTTWELALLGTANLSAKPQMAVINLGQTYAINKLSAGNSNAFPAASLGVNTIPGAVFTGPSGGSLGNSSSPISGSQATTPAKITLPPGTYQITLVLEGGHYIGTSGIGGSLAFPIHSFYYDFPDGSGTNTKREHTNTISNLNGNGQSNWGMQIQSVATFTNTRDLIFRFGWGSGGNVNGSNDNPGPVYYFNGTTTQMTVVRVL